MVVIHTKGYGGNGELSKWAVVGVSDGRKLFQAYRVEDYGMTRKMELLAIKAAVKATVDLNLDSKEPVVIFTPNSYLPDVFDLWLHRWIKKGFTNSEGKEVYHKELLKEIYEMMRGRQIMIAYSPDNSKDFGDKSVTKLFNSLKK